ncbi:MAG: BolA family protein [Alphaproteobacteria bacterium]
MTTLQHIIEEKLRQEFLPTILRLHNESHLHQGHAGDDGSGHSHFSLLLVSAAFAGCSRLKRQQMVLSVLQQEISKLHAFSMQLQTPLEYKP